jgi:hypothetical protein
MGKRVPVDENTRCKICGEFAAVAWISFSSKKGIYFNDTTKAQYGTCSNKQCGK